MSVEGANWIVDNDREPGRGWSAYVVFELPSPPSSNNLFGNRKDGQGRYRTRAYEDWIVHAGYALNRARVPTINGPVKITMSFPEPKGRADLDGKPKAVDDLLVRHGILPDDSNKYIRELRLKWCEPGDQCRIEIEAAA